MRDRDDTLVLLEAADVARGAGCGWTGDPGAGVGGLLCVLPVAGVGGLLPASVAGVGGLLPASVAGVGGWLPSLVVGDWGLLPALDLFSVSFGAAVWLPLSPCSDSTAECGRGLVAESPL